MSLLKKVFGLKTLLVSLFIALSVSVIVLEHSQSQASPGLETQFLTKQTAPRTLMAVLYGPMTYESVMSVAYTLKEAKSTDTVIIDINSPGGNLAAFAQLLELRRSFTGHLIVTVRIGSMAASAAALFLTVADEVQVELGSTVMYHLPSSCIVDEKKPEERNCKKIYPNTTDASEKWAVELDLELIRLAIQRCILNQQDYDKIVAGDDVSKSGREIIKSMRSCPPVPVQTL